MKMIISALLFLIFVTQCSTKEKKNIQWSDNVKVVLDNTTPLKYDRGNRLPLYLWPAIDPGELNDKDAEQLVKEFNTRGVGIVCSWNFKNVEETMTRCLTLARAQKKLGQRINIDATSLLESFFNGDENTAHIDENGKPFFDNSFGDHKMGCPFAIDYRKKEIRERVELYIKKYKELGLPVDFIFTDWEIDGPLEVNNAIEASKKCARCRKYLGDGFSYTEFQKTMREMRAYLQNYSYSTPVLSNFPHALVGNYAVYPNDGYRYWYDYFEHYADGQPYKADQRAKYRQWYNDFPATGFTFAMPVVYTWDPIYSWYDFENSDYRWFYNMLLVASNAGKSTPYNIPIISFVHWHTILVSEKPDSTIKQMSKKSYQELLWHMLLRGTDTFFMWSGKKEYPEEVRLLQEVYAAAQQYGKFLDNGLPITFDVPNKPGTVISGLALGDSVLIRRTDFGTNHSPVEILAGTKIIKVDYAPGTCRVLSLY
jgi:hypothetical protein